MALNCAWHKARPRGVTAIYKRKEIKNRVGEGDRFQFYYLFWNQSHSQYPTEMKIVPGWKSRAENVCFCEMY